MIMHNSPYEKQGWIPINKELPVAQEKVELSCIRFLDWNLESMEWQTKGWLTKSGIWSMKKNSEKINNCSKPTHWKKI